jgi:hypothetical protein
MAHRIDGIKINLNRLPDVEIARIRDNLIQKVKLLMQDITILEEILLARQLTELPFDDNAEG